MAPEPITRQEQIIAGKELEPITRMEKFLKDYGVSKYFGETTVKGDTLTWDGNTEGHLTVPIPQMEGAFFVRISEAVPTFDDCKDGITETLSNGHTDEWTHNDLVETFYPQAGILCAQGLTVIPSDNYEVQAFGVVFPKAGCYTQYMEGQVYYTSFTIPGYNGFETTAIKPIDAKYLPPLASPSGKKFKLSVDDSGVLSATEV